MSNRIWRRGALFAALIFGALVLSACAGGGAALSGSSWPGITTSDEGIAYVVTFTASGGTPPYSFRMTAGSLPPGLTLDQNAGVLSGTPTAAGSYSFDIVAIDDSDCSSAIVGPRVTDRIADRL